MADRKLVRVSPMKYGKITVTKVEIVDIRDDETLVDLVRELVDGGWVQENESAAELSEMGEQSLDCEGNHVDGTPAKREDQMKDFFISYNSADRAWAKWIAWTLEEVGYSVVIQAWDFRPGGDFILEMHKAVIGTEKTVIVLSDAYLGAEYTQPEWSAAFSRDPRGDARTLIPLRVEECSPHGLLKTRIYADIIGLPEDDAKAVLLAALKERDKPDQPPAFPGRSLRRTVKRSTGPPTIGGRTAPTRTIGAPGSYPGQQVAMSETKALDLWREKLEFLHAQEAVATDAAQKFALKKQIEQAERKIRRLGS